jgi:hypothetical protein
MDQLDAITMTSDRLTLSFSFQGRPEAVPFEVKNLRDQLRVMQSRAGAGGLDLLLPPSGS